MIRKSDKGPGRSRPPRTKQPRTSSTGGGGGTSRTGCLWSFAPLLLLGLSIVGLLTHAP